MSACVQEAVPALPAVRVSFQSSTADAWANSFMRHLQTALDATGLQDARLLMSRTSRAAQALFDGHGPARPDTQSSTVLGMCALMLSAYRELSVELADSGEAFDLVERSFDHAYQAFIQNICKPLLLNSSRSPRTLAGMNFKTWSEGMYRRAGHPHDLGRNADITGYHHFFLTHDAPALAKIIHRADQAWIEAVAAYGRSHLNERRSTRASDSAGRRDAGFAPFRFAASGEGRTIRKPDVILKLQIKMAADRRGDPAAADRRHWDGIDRRQSARRQDDERIRF